jgi:hypothetical protein
MDNIESTGIQFPGRETRFVILEIHGVPGFTELVLTSSEEMKLNQLKAHLVGLKVALTMGAENRTDHIGIITDIRIVVTHYGIIPGAIVNFPCQVYSRLRGLNDLMIVNDMLQNRTSAAKENELKVPTLKVMKLHVREAYG